MSFPISIGFNSIHVNFPPPLAYWTMNDSDYDGYTLTESFSGYDGYVEESITATGVQGQVGQAFRFAITDYIRLGDYIESVICGADKQWTVALWVKFSSFGVITIFLSKHSDSTCSENGRQFIIGLDQSERLQLWAHSGLSSGFRLIRGTSVNNDTSKWYHFVVVYDGTVDSSPEDRVELYVDSVAETKVVAASSGSFPFDIPATGPAKASIGMRLKSDGTRCGAHGTIGDISELILWDRLLTQEEVTKLYEVGKLGMKAR